MGIIKPAYANDKNELKQAIKLKEQAVIVTDKNLFWAMEKRISINIKGKGIKKIGKYGLAWGVLTIGVIAPIGLPLLCVSGLGTIAGYAIDKYKNYNLLLDYERENILFIKIKGDNPFNENTDIIEGIDFDEIQKQSWRK